MRNPSLHALLRFLTCLVLALLPAALTSLLAQTITEFPVLTPHADIHGMTVGPDGALWFNESGVQKIGRITTGGVVTEFPVPDASFNIAVGPDGNLWFTPYGGIGRLTPAGIVTMFPPPPGTDPTEFSPWDIERGPDSAMWFSVVQGYIGRITMEGAMTLFSVPGTGTKGVYGLAFGSDGNVWYGDATRGVLGRMTTSGSFTEFPVWAPFDLTIGPDGELWGSGFQGLGRISMSGSIHSFPVDAYRTLTTGPDGNLWVALSPTKIGRVTPAGDLTEFLVPTTAHSPFGEGAFPFAVVAGPDGNIWFTEEYGNKIGRLNLQGSTAACTPDAHTLCLNQSRFAVAADFQTSPSGPTVSATARPLTSDSGFFWFFDPNNVEIVVKVLNACGTSSHAYWVFAAGLTNVQVDLSVTDTLRAETRHYTNPLNTPFLPIQDTAAFSTCP